MFVGATTDRFRNEASETGTRRLLLRVCEEIAVAADDMVRKCRAGACRGVASFGGSGVACEGGLSVCRNVGRVNKGQGSGSGWTRLKGRAWRCDASSSPH